MIIINDVELPNSPWAPYAIEFQNEQMHRGKQYGKKKRSWVSMIIQIIVLVLTAITGYSMYNQPIFNIVFAKIFYEFNPTLNSSTSTGWPIIGYN